MVVEVELAAMAARRATADDLKKMEHILRRLKQTVGRGRLTAHVTSEFNRARVRAGPIRPLCRMAEMLARARLARGMRVEHALPDIAAGEYESHRLLLDAVASRDADRARSAMREPLEIAHGREQRINALRRELAAPTNERSRTEPSR